MCMKRFILIRNDISLNIKSLNKKRLNFFFILFQKGAKFSEGRTGVFS